MKKSHRDVVKSRLIKHVIDEEKGEYEYTLQCNRCGRETDRAGSFDLSYGGAWVPEHVSRPAPTNSWGHDAITVLAAAMDLTGYGS